jgi:signal transduction histidine kinase
LVGDLLDLSKLQNSDFPIEKEPIDLYDVLEDAVRSVRGLADAKDIQLKTEFLQKGVNFIGDYARLRQMLIILFDNAIKFSAPGKTIEIYCGDSFIRIRDHGAGIPEAEIPYIFDRFHKSRDEMNKEGTGLGLAIAKQIADRHGISLGVTSKVGVGTEFTVSFK